MMKRIIEEELSKQVHSAHLTCSALQLLHSKFDSFHIPSWQFYFIRSQVQIDKEFADFQVALAEKRANELVYLDIKPNIAAANKYLKCPSAHTWLIVLHATVLTCDLAVGRPRASYCRRCTSTSAEDSEGPEPRRATVCCRRNGWQRREYIEIEKRQTSERCIDRRKPIEAHSFQSYLCRLASICWLISEGGSAGWNCRHTCICAGAVSRTTKNSRSKVMCLTARIYLAVLTFFLLGPHMLNWQFSHNQSDRLSLSTCTQYSKNQSATTVYSYWTKYDSF